MQRRMHFFASNVYKNYNLWCCQKVCDAIVYLLDNIFIIFGTKLEDFKLQADIIGALNSTSRYRDNSLNITFLL